MSKIEPTFVNESKQTRRQCGEPASRPRLQRGAMVFWGDDRRPWWVIEWQADNGPGCYWIVNAAGDCGTASENELSMYPKS